MFCSKCGAQIPDDSTFCAKCGAQIPNGTMASSHEDVFTLTIDRKSQVYLVNPPIKILIDGTIRKNIANGESIEVPLARGSHIIEFTSSARKTTKSVELTGDTVLAVGWSRLSGKIVVDLL